MTTIKVKMAIPVSLLPEGGKNPLNEGEGVIYVKEIRVKNDPPQYILVNHIEAVKKEMANEFLSFEIEEINQNTNEQ